jgi:hypothetical protein
VHPASPDSEERRLLAEYQTATRFYSWAASELSRQRETASFEDYQKLRKMTQDAFAACERARREMNNFGST